MLSLSEKFKTLNENIRKKVLYSTIALITALFFMLIPNQIPILDKKGDEYFNIAIKETAVIYAITRITNSFVSLAKDTELTITPMGVGITISIGQILDPLDDATERLSSILTIAIATLGLMKISKEILSVLSYNIISFLLFLVAFLVWIDYFKNLTRIFLIVVISMLALRLALPICGMINSKLYEIFFQPKINQNLQAFKDIKKLYTKTTEKNFLDINTDFSSENQNKGFLKKIKNKIKTLNNSSKFIKEKSAVIKEVVEYVWENKGKFIEAIINLIILEISIIFIQAIALPLFVLWILLKLLNGLFEYKPKEIQI